MKHTKSKKLILEREAKVEGTNKNNCFLIIIRIELIKKKSK